MKGLENVRRQAPDGFAKRLKSVTGHYPVGFLHDNSLVISVDEVIERNTKIPLTSAMKAQIALHNPYGIREGGCFLNFPTTKEECDLLGWSVASIDLSKGQEPISPEDFAFIYENEA